MIDITDIHIGGAWNHTNQSVHHEIYTVQRLIFPQSQDNKHFPNEIKRENKKPLFFFQCWVLRLQEGITGGKKDSYVLFKNPFWGNMRLKQLIYSFVCDRFGTDIWTSNTLIHAWYNITTGPWKAAFLWCMYFHLVLFLITGLFQLF